MAQTATMLVDGEDSGAIYTNKLNAILQAIHTDFTGSIAPSSPVADMRWRDTSTTPPTMRRRNATNTGWAVDTTGAVNSVNGRIGQVTIQTSDVFGVLPTPTGNNYKLLALNSTATGLEWVPTTHPFPITVATSTYSFTEADHNRLVILTNPSIITLTFNNLSTPGITIPFIATNSVAMHAAQGSGARLVQGIVDGIDTKDVHVATYLGDGLWSVGGTYITPDYPEGSPSD